MILLLICCSLLLLLWGSLFALCYVTHCFVSFLVFNHLYERENERERELERERERERDREKERVREREIERERAVCSTLFAFLVSCDCYVALSHEALGLSAVCDCGISWSYSLVFSAFII